MPQIEKKIQVKSFLGKIRQKKKFVFWHNLDKKKFLNKEIRINIEKKIFIRNLRKIGYSINLNINQIKFFKMITKAFQRRFRQKLINGIIDKECLIISKNLVETIK